MRAPRGAVVRELPPHCARVYVGRVVYYRYGDVYYQPVPRGYMVVEAPTVVRPPPPLEPSWRRPSRSASARTPKRIIGCTS